MLAVESCDLVRLDLAKVTSELEDERNTHAATKALMETYKEYANAHSILNTQCAEDNKELAKRLSREKAKTSILSGIGIILILVILL